MSNKVVIILPEKLAKRMLKIVRATCARIKYNQPKSPDTEPDTFNLYKQLLNQIK